MEKILESLPMIVATYKYDTVVLEISNSIMSR